ncbi:stage III sporulation protein AG [Aneurinibacillus aneurinilyticus]|jgi:stage III sporulation protein AG|uniref:Stage III sporulation protein AG n=2 Tax=Aneurinibacillus aneurinilyticus TaxID=1391 RepID=A0A848D4N2_ANEAE|nr:stage III sporulation protein AG [Aneurinibacillus aneurinilyticus]ERI08041.1 stage III sporulation protein AG [Aneurinibacillus aneurinilyticus ATCC 12856]MCI1695870.1 stage III sporulation protein AG [Aneurinibacillus aneurinilyticus]MED0707279.1 stage III sporulation protein AG [Aneurinibacillus aneurinilyticus]MED0722246.1 stage III sporulation protein AG [Aneurinibacillus aneurinilyticus]MED0730472.1 stage III sporulation protein AG [Aneurinibacillus aneurinilyticus]
MSKKEKDMQDGTKKLGKMQWLMVAGALGIGLMLMGSFYTFDKGTPSSPSPPATEGEQAVFAQKKQESYTMEEYEQMYEKKLREVLQTITGVGDVSVMVNLESTEEIVVEKNTNRQTQSTKEGDKGATRDIASESIQEQVVITKDDGGERPVVMKTVKPKVRGVVVVASGAGNLQVKAWILEAVQKVLAVPSYKISILPKKA